MGLTHLSGLAVSGTTRLSANVIATGSGKYVKATKLQATGTTTLSGNVTATGTSKSLTATWLKATATTTLSGNVTATGTGKTTQVTTLQAGALKIASAANAVCGKRFIATAATGVKTIVTTAVKTSSRIFVTPQVKMAGNPGANIHCTVATIASGASFSVKLSYGDVPTGCTGMINWMIVNV
jgi:hypothetical protein